MWGRIERVDEAVSSFYAQISTPVLANVDVSLLDKRGDKVMVEDVFPYPLPDLFAGEQLVVAGRYRDGGPVSVELTGDVNGASRLFVYPNQELSDKGGEPFVARLWATRMIGALLEQIRRSGYNQEVVDSIVDLSMRYGIVTPYTSYLVVEPMMAQGAPAAPDDQVMLQARSLRGEAAAAVANEAAAMVDQAAAGPAAVQASKARGDLQAAETVAVRSGRALCQWTHLHTPGRGDHARRSYPRVVG